MPVGLERKNKSQNPFTSIYTLQVRVYPYQGMTYYELLAMVQDRVEELIEDFLEPQKLFELFAGKHDHVIESNPGDYFEFTITNPKL